MNRKMTTLQAFIIICLSTTSCIKEKNLYEENPNRKQEVISKEDFLYPFQHESQKKEIEITIHTKEDKQVADITTEIPALKYNKSWLFMLTQDDCMQSAFSCTWAAINGKPLSRTYYYDLAQLKVGDLPPDAYTLGKTLGSTDGTGREVRFSFTTTLAPEASFMNANTVIHKDNKKTFERFYKKSGMVWGSAVEMTNYGVGIAFHDLNVSNAEKNVPTLVQHLNTAQSIINEKIPGRNCKMMAEPNGEKIYIEAALAYPQTTTFTSQASTGQIKNIILKPFQNNEDLSKRAIERKFYENPKNLQTDIATEFAKNYRDCLAIYVGAHNTDYNWVNLLKWLNDTYGKNGNDGVWMPNQEEYYEYIHYRKNTQPTATKVDEHTWKVKATLQGEGNFYYPSITINLAGIKFDDIKKIETNNDITGFSFGAYNDGVIMNIDCRTSLPAHAENFVVRYERDPSNASNKADALYFVNMLKDSEKKTALLNRIK